ncbi:MAG: sulfite exporter TauE/SafE family protein [Phycisphaerae bacterium]|nr:sulfite exporter TauE/SafE family protein [Phycisphaerae bacterium]
MPITPVEILSLLAVGLAAGLLGGLLGIGGSVIMIPAMVFLFHDRAWDNQHLYQAAAMVVNIVVALPAMRRHQQAGAIPREYVRVFLPVTMVFMVVGVLLSNLLGGDILRRIFALFLVYVVVSTASKVFRRSADHKPEHTRITPQRSGFIGIATGTMGGLLGIGGGIVSVPLAHLICKLPLRSAIAASASTMVFSSTLGAALKIATLGQHHVSWSQAMLLAAVLAPTALLGGHFGAGLTHRAPINAMRLIMAVVLAVMAARMTGLF